MPRATPTPIAALELARLRYRAAQRVADGSARTLREAAGVSQAELGQVLRVSTMSVSSWERGHRVPGTVQLLRAWLDLLDQWEAAQAPMQGAAMA